MSVKIVIKPNTYFDSVSLMSISTRANKLDGVEQAFVAMATEMNKGVLGLLTPELEQAKNGDLMIVINGKAGADNEQLLVEIEELFNTKAQSGSHEARYATIGSAKKHIPESNLAVISVNGLFAAREARQALQNDLNVMLFSDNVSVEDELALKQLAHEKGLLMMGPDCGTAIINGAALCFGNAVRRGNIGIVGASGTGSQELSVRIHEFGGGVSQLIGTGGRDLSEKIGGLMMLDAIGMLENDPQTEIIALISKPPAPAVARKVLERAGLSINDMDVIELNEAFASQALGVLRQLGLPDDAEHVNPNGGAIALGHPLGMSGARLALAASNELHRRNGRYALCTMCIGVGQGIAMILERV